MLLSTMRDIFRVVVFLHRLMPLYSINYKRLPNMSLKGSRRFKDENPSYTYLCIAYPMRTQRVNLKLLIYNIETSSCSFIHPFLVIVWVIIIDLWRVWESLVNNNKYAKISILVSCHIIISKMDSWSNMSLRLPKSSWDHLPKCVADMCTAPYLRELGISQLDSTWLVISNSAVIFLWNK